MIFDEVNTMNLMRNEEFFFNPTDGSVESSLGKTVGYIDFSESENLLLYKDANGNTELISKSGSIVDLSESNESNYKNWRYYE